MTAPGGAHAYSERTLSVAPVPFAAAIRNGSSEATLSVYGKLFEYKQQSDSERVQNV